MRPPKRTPKLPRNTSAKPRLKSDPAAKKARLDLQVPHLPWRQDLRAFMNHTGIYQREEAPTSEGGLVLVWYRGGRYYYAHLIGPTLKLHDELYTTLGVQVPKHSMRTAKDWLSIQYATGQLPYTQLHERAEIAYEEHDQMTEWKRREHSKKSNAATREANRQARIQAKAAQYALSMVEKANQTALNKAADKILLEIKRMVKSKQGQAKALALKHKDVTARLTALAQQQFAEVYPELTRKGNKHNPFDSDPSRADHINSADDEEQSS